MSQFHSRMAVPFFDDTGKPVLNIFGRAMQRPSDALPSFFADQGLRAAINNKYAMRYDTPPTAGYAELAFFRQGGRWDVQRVGTDEKPTEEFIDYATVVIGLYGAAAEISIDFILDTENGYAGLRSNFGRADMDPEYVHLPKRNVFNTKTGYRLYQSGLIGPSRKP